MQIDFDNAAWAFAGTCLGYAIATSILTAKVLARIAALPGQIREIAREEAQHKFAQHDTTIAFHTDAITEHDRMLAALTGKGVRNG